MGCNVPRVCIRFGLKASVNKSGLVAATTLMSVSGACQSETIARHTALDKLRGYVIGLFGKTSLQP